MGVVGGTFDPIHLGHVALAEAACDCARLDRVLLVPSGLPPHRAQPLAAAPDRLQMCRIAARGHPGLEVSDLELRRPGPSYTVDTLAALQRERSLDVLHLVLGWDAARHLRSWHQPDEVLRLAALVVVTRPGLSAPSQGDLETAGLDSGRTLLCDSPTPDVEATEVRLRLERGEDCTGLLDSEVAAYIATHRLYRGERSN